MNRDDIIRMAQEAGAEFAELPMMDAWLFTDDKCLERFAALVASAERDRIKQANAPEIERVNAHIKELEDAVKETLAQPEQHQDWCASLTRMFMSMPPKPAPCNCKPPRRTWVGLTLDERIEFAQDVDWAAGAYCEYAEKIEAKLKELNT